MRKLTVFNQISLDGYISDARGDMSWAHKHDAEWTKFVSRNAGGGGALVFGRVTYDLMASYWPTPLAAEHDPKVAGQMNALPKIVFSRTLKKVAWQNTTLVKTDPAAAMRKLKAEAGPDLTILGSASIVSALTNARLVDEYNVVVNALVLGSGRGLFAGVAEPLRLVLKETRVFRNGNVLLTYTPHS
jgi:dihydrofolate reductase